MGNDGGGGGEVFYGHQSRVGSSLGKPGRVVLRPGMGLEGGRGLGDGIISRGNAAFARHGSGNSLKMCMYVRAWVLVCMNVYVTNGKHLCLVETRNK